MTILAALLAFSWLFTTSIADEFNDGEHPKMVYALNKTLGSKTRFMVIMNPSTANATVLTDLLMLQANDTALTKGAVWDWALKGFVLDIEDVEDEQTRLEWQRRIVEKTQVMLENDDVDYVEQDQAFAATQTIQRVNADVNVQPSSPWGLDRVDQQVLPLDGNYVHDAQGAKDVTIYILDTGIRSTHEDFGGRVNCEFSAIQGEGPCDDQNGHGTHVAGTAGGHRFGVAKNATLSAIKVLSNSGSGSTSGVIAGVNYVAGVHRTDRQHRRVINMSLGGGSSGALDRAVSNAMLDGIFVAAAAGNDNQDACLASPGRSQFAMTVGATDRSDVRADFSNFGNCVDIFGPGVDIQSTWFESDTSTNAISGTSMACPHVAGIAAVYMQQSVVEDDYTFRIKDQIIADAAKDTIENVEGSPNILATTANMFNVTVPGSKSESSASAWTSATLHAVMTILA